MNSNAIQLSEPTVFPDMNKRESQDPQLERSTLKLKSLKYKYFREIMKYPEIDQMHQLMLLITELSEDDLGELLANDAANIAHIIFEGMEKYMQLGRKIMKKVQDE